MLRRVVLSILISVLAGTLFCLRTGAGGKEPELKVLSSMEDVRLAFEKDRGSPRIVFLLSPT